MCSTADNCLSKAFDIYCQCGLPLLDEVGSMALDNCTMCIQMNDGATTIKLPAMLKYEIGEDG